jgi:hypothetical protein
MTARLCFLTGLDRSCDYFIAVLLGHCFDHPQGLNTMLEAQMKSTSTTPVFRISPDVDFFHGIGTPNVVALDQWIHRSSIVFDKLNATSPSGFQVMAAPPVDRPYKHQDNRYMANDPNLLNHIRGKLDEDFQQGVPWMPSSSVDHYSQIQAKSTIVASTTSKPFLPQPPHWAMRRDVQIQAKSTNVDSTGRKAFLSQQPLWSMRRDDRIQTQAKRTNVDSAASKKRKKEEHEEWRHVNTAFLPQQPHWSMRRDES